MIDTSKIDFNWWEHKYGSISKPFDNWMGGVDEPTRVYFRNKVKEHQYKSILDVGAGKAIDWDGFKKEMYPIEYTAMDITPQFVKEMVEKGIEAKVGDVMKLPYLNGRFDVVYARHLLEHMVEIEKPLSEMCRVARKMICIIFFLPPVIEDNIKVDEMLNGEVYKNEWGRKHIENIVGKYGVFEWVRVGKQEILFVYKKSSSKTKASQAKIVKGLSPCCRADIREEKQGDIIIKRCNRCGKVVL